MMELTTEISHGDYRKLVVRHGAAVLFHLWLDPRHSRYSTRATAKNHAARVLPELPRSWAAGWTGSLADVAEWLTSLGVPTGAFWQAADELGWPQAAAHQAEIAAYHTPAPPAPGDDFQRLLQAARCAEADLTGIMPEFEPSGDREHPGWQTLAELQVALAAYADTPAQPVAASVRALVSQADDLIARLDEIDPEDANDEAEVINATTDLTLVLAELANALAAETRAGQAVAGGIIAELVTCVSAGLVGTGIHPENVLAVQAAEKFLQGMSEPDDRMRQALEHLQRSRELHRQKVEGRE